MKQENKRINYYKNKRKYRPYVGYIETAYYVDENNKIQRNYHFTNRRQEIKKANRIKTRRYKNFVDEDVNLILEDDLIDSKFIKPSKYVSGKQRRKIVTW